MQHSRGAVGGQAFAHILGDQSSDEASLPSSVRRRRKAQVLMTKVKVRLNLMLMLVNNNTTQKIVKWIN